MLSIVLLLAVSQVFSQEKIQVKSFTPSGYAKSVGQVRVEFNQPLVRFGDLNFQAPAQSRCFDSKKGQGRWVDTRNWVFDFNEPLVGGLSCDVYVKGEKYSFNTGGPHVRQIFPYLYRDVDPEQNFVLLLDSEVQTDTVKNAYFIVQGLGDRIPVKILTGGDAQKVFTAAKTENKYESEVFRGPYVVVKSSRPFPAGSKISLVWDKSIQSPSGHSSKEDEVFEFTVQNSFKAEFSCDRETSAAPCIPLLPLRLSFNADIPIDVARQIYIQGADKKIYNSDLEPGAERDVRYLEFKGPFPPSTEFTVVIPKKVRDKDERLLTNQNQFPLKVKTGADPALLKFASSFGVIEAGPDAAMAVTLRRVESAIATQFQGWTGQFRAKEFAAIVKGLGELQRSPYGETSLDMWQGRPVQKITVQKPKNPAQTELVGIPLKKKGFYLVEMKSPLLGESLLGKGKDFYVRSGALVTNLAVHIKYTQSAAWVWVTDLKTAQVVSGAKVQIYDNAGAVVATQITNANGLSSFKFPKPLRDWKRNPQGFFYEGFFAVAEKGDDFSFAHSSWDKGIESWRFQIRGPETDSPYVGHAILDRTLLRPEEKVSAKIVLRKTSSKGLDLPGVQEWPDHVLLAHDSGLQEFKLPLKWNKNLGTARIDWTIPSGAKLGRWSLTLLKEPLQLRILIGDIAIENFRVPLIQVRIDGQKPVYVAEKNIPLNVSGTYFAGGPTSHLKAKLRWSVEPGHFLPENEDLVDYVFATGGVKEGLFRPGDGDSHRYLPQSGIRDFVLNAQGASLESISDLKYAGGPQSLRAEVEYKDPNGEIQSVVRSFQLWPSGVVLGIKARGWSAKADAVEFDVVALDLQQRPLKGQTVQIDLYTGQYYSHRKRLVGGFYAYEDFQEYKKVGELCRGTTDDKGSFFCRGKSESSGRVIAVVSTKDSQGRLSQSQVSQWIVKPGENQWFGSEDNDRADLIALKKTYEPGETAELQLRTPFPHARVLVTVERDTILHTEVVEVSGENPVLRIPIKKEYAPNVVISAFAIRGRLAGPKPTALVDLAKPAYKLGLAQIKVGLGENILKVQVATDKKSYKAREKAKVRLAIKDFKGRPAANADVALVAVDEGLLALRDNSSWNLLSAMMQMRPHTVQTATSQTLVVGKRHFGLKAVPIGGDGGGLTRELFDTLLYWNPSLKLNKKGEAQVEITLNDSTTSFRIVAIALNGHDQFGTGWTSIRSTQDVMILPGLSSVAREGDAFQAGFTVRNASSKSEEVELSLKIAPNQKVSYANQKVTLPPGAAKEVFWPVEVSGTEPVTYVVTARNTQGQFLDEVKRTQRVLPFRQARIYQSEFGQWPDLETLVLKQPDGAVAEKGSIQVDFSSFLGGPSVGLKDFWDNYVFTCLEQLASRAVTLNDRKEWQKIEQKLDAYIDKNGLLRYFPAGSLNGSVALTTYLLSVAHEAGFDISEEHELRLLDSVEAYAEGRLKEHYGMDRADSVLRRISAFETLSRYRRLKTALLSSVEYQPTQWPLYTLLEWYQIHLWEKDLPGREKKLSDIESHLRNRFYFSAKKLQLRDESLEAMPWLMRSSDSAILRLILTTAALPQWQQDTPRIYLGALARQQQGAWVLTADNAWGALAMRRLKDIYSKDKVEGEFLTELDGLRKRFVWAGKESGTVSLPWTSSSGTLKLRQEGEGRPWITVSAKAALPVTKAVFAGFTAEKKIEPVEQKKKGRWSVGDIAKVIVRIKAKAPQTWVVLEDPIPTGASVLQPSFATSIERKTELIRFYFDWLSSDEQVIEYSLRFNQVGTYPLPATRVESMYSPDIFAELPESSLVVAE